MAREAEFTEQISALIAPDPDARIRHLSDLHRRSNSTIIRQIIDAGLPLVEAMYARQEAERQQREQPAQ